VSLTEAPIVRSIEGDLVVEPMVPREIPSSRRELDALRREALADPLFAGTLVGRDGDAAALVVSLHEISNRDYLESGLDDRIAALAEATAGDAAEVWMTGGPHLYVESARVLLADTVRLPALILGALAVVLAVSFRTLRGVWVPLATIVIAVVWTLAGVAVVGQPLNAVTTLVPGLLTTLGLAYAVHVTTGYYDAAREEPAAAPRELVGHAMQQVGLPVLLTGLTTAAGFGSLVLSPLAAVRDFGILSVFGVACTLLATLTFTPAVLALLPRPRRLPPATSLGFDRFAGALARFAHGQRPLIFVAAVLAFGVALVGVSRIEVGTQQIDKFREDAPVRVHWEAVNASLGGANPLTVVLETAAPEGFLEPDVLREVEALQAWLLDQPEVGGAVSLVDTLKVLHRAFRDGDEAAFAVPERRSLITQLLFVGAGDELGRFVDAGFETMNVQVRARVIDSAEVAALVARLEARLAELPEPLSGRVTGTAVVFNQALDEIIRGQTVSVVAALGLIYLILAAMFVSLRIGAVALIPNVLPMAGYFGALGLSGVTLSPGTSLIAPMVLGVAVDDTIHYFARFIADARRFGDERRATESTLRAVGRPVTYTTVALCAGFLMLNASEFRTQGQLGTLAAFSLAFAWLVDVTLTPALCARLRIATLWDLLTLDLGEDPQHRIVLFRGLSSAQARIVALLGRLLPVRAGDRLWHAGEPGGALYVVIDGRLRATLAGDGERHVLETHGRGDVVGEVGFFHHERAAEVEVLEDSRLLRFTPAQFEQLQRRYPRISAVVARNLNEVLAERLAGVTGRLV
jgi:predicted RND superfamily exporter protein